MCSGWRMSIDRGDWLSPDLAGGGPPPGANSDGRAHSRRRCVDRVARPHLRISHAARGGGYLYRFDGGDSGGHLFVRDSEPAVRVAHIHVFARGDRQWDEEGLAGGTSGDQGTGQQVEGTVMSVATPTRGVGEGRARLMQRMCQKHTEYCTHQSHRFWGKAMNSLFSLLTLSRCVMLMIGMGVLAGCHQQGRMSDGFYESAVRVVDQLNDEPDRLHSENTPAVAWLVHAGLPALPCVVDLLCDESEETRMRAQCVVTTVTMRVFGFVPGSGWATVDGEDRWLHFWQQHGDYDWRAAPEIRLPAWRSLRTWVDNNCPQLPQAQFETAPRDAVRGQS